MIMNYWRFPAQGEGNWCITPEPDYGPQCADFAGTTYDWDGMVSDPVTECNPIALLLWHIGIGCNVSYTPTGTGAAQYLIPQALQDYFRYSTDCYTAIRSLYTYEEWRDLLKHDLDQGKPVQYRGEGNSGGHAWVCDGYQGEDYFHMNWGWGGDFNGYYYLDDLVTGNWYWGNNQMATVNIEPEPEQYPSYCSGQKVLSKNLSGSLEDGSGPVLNYPNNTDCSWLISLEDSIESVALSFIRFSLAEGDLVKVYDGNSESAPLLGSFTGNTLPPDLMTKGPAMLIKFTSDSANTAQGFLAEYTTDSYNFCQASATMTEATGIISDGSRDFLYQNNSSCMWSIVPPDNGPLTLEFSSFNTEPVNDMLEVFDLVSGDLLARYSGDYSTPPAPVTSQSGQMLLYWTTNKLVRGKGWEASYTNYLGEVEMAGRESIFLLRNYPNPFSKSTTITYWLFQRSKVKFTIVNSYGQIVEQLQLQGYQGQNQLLWERRTHPTGIYVLMVEANGKMESLKTMISE
jgi:hypothetical protein